MYAAERACQAESGASEDVLGSAGYRCREMSLSPGRSGWWSMWSRLAKGEPGIDAARNRQKPSPGEDGIHWPKVDAQDDRVEIDQHSADE